MKKLITFFGILTILFVFVSAPLTPVFAASTPDNYSGLVKCSGVVQNSGEVECNFNTLLGTVKSLINWMFLIAIPIAVVLFAYAGLLVMSGKEDNKKKGKGVFLNVVIGFAIMLVAYTVVQTVVGWLVDPCAGTTTFLSTASTCPTPVNNNAENNPQENQSTN